MQNYTIRYKLWERKKNSKNLCPVVLIITISRQVTFIQTSYKIPADAWNQEKQEVKQAYPNAKKINADLRFRKSDVEKLLVDKSLENKTITGSQIKKIISGEGKDNHDFYKFADDLMNSKKSERVIYNKELNRLKTFSPTLSFSDIDVTFLRKYVTHEADRDISQNTINSTCKWFRRVINYAEDEGLIKENPFDNFKIPKYVKPEKMYLVTEEREAMVKLLDDTSGSLYHTLCYFLLGCYTGFRHSDWSRFNPDTQVYNEIIRLRTKKNKRDVAMPVGKTLAGIIERLKDCPPPLTNQKCNVLLKALAGCAKIKKDITCHTARHSFGYMCASNRLPKSVTAELMGISVQTVEIYYHLSGDDILGQASVLKSL